MKILIIEPGKHPRETEIDGSLESMQKTVGGYLQAIYPFEDEVALVCDDESKLKSDTQWNRMLPETGDMKLSITLDTLTARILKLSSDSQSRIEPTPFYSWWNTTDCRADSAVAPVAHKISPDHRF